MSPIARLVRIEGRVQGVWYRGWTVQQAQLRGLTGWVRNRADGSVEALFCGSETVVAEMIEACRRGPPAASVTAITSQEAPMSGDGASGHGEFHQRPTE